MRCRLLGALALLSACSGESTPLVYTPLAGPDGGYVTIGSPCTPAQESDPSFGGFSRSEVSVESSQGPSSAPVCIVFEFEGRVSCPYGQAAPGDAAPAACTTPDGQPVTVSVAPQCLDRRAANVVVWSCLCDGVASDGDNQHCNCPSGTTCEQAGLSGSYCLPSGTNAAVSCTEQCEPGVHPCN
jgi:hypothetical protein